MLSFPRFFTDNGILNPGSYKTLEKDSSAENPLKYVGTDFSVKRGFHTNLPIVILEIDGELPEYKYFTDNGIEISDKDIEPYTFGKMTVIYNENGESTPFDTPIYESGIKIKKRGHTSMAFDKPQYKIKTFLPDGTNNDASILGMGEGNDWILIGSLADKSLEELSALSQLIHSLRSARNAKRVYLCRTWIGTQNTSEVRVHIDDVDLPSFLSFAKTDCLYQIDLYRRFWQPPRLLLTGSEGDAL